MATASSLGDYYQYVIDRPVDLARQKSALLPIVNKDVEGKRVSIYNPAVQPKHPLLGPEVQEHVRHAADAGSDHGIRGVGVRRATPASWTCSPTKNGWCPTPSTSAPRCRVKNGNNTARITSVKAVKGIITTHTVIREERVYDVSNRSTTDRTLLIEHPNRKGQGFAFIGENKPKEEAADVYRFELAVGAKKDLSYTVIEERPVDASVQLTNNADDQIRYFINLKEAPAGAQGQVAGGAQGQGVRGTRPGRTSRR